jgi:adenylate kinase family enzyme
VKIYVIGQSGSGKSYFSRKLSSIYKIEHIEMDAWNQECGYDLDKFYTRLNQYVDSHQSWIIDGKYKRIRERLIKEADQIYYLDMPFTRSVIANINRELGAQGKITKKFVQHLTKVIKEFFPTRKQIYSELKGHEAKLTVLKSRREVNELLIHLQDN